MTETSSIQFTSSQVSPSSSILGMTLHCITWYCDGLDGWQGQDISLFFTVTTQPNKPTGATGHFPQGETDHSFTSTANVHGVALH
jgi:hypothetical protein